MEVKFYSRVDDAQLKFSVIVSRYHGKWVFCKHKNRNTLECPGGTREANESIDACAVRELKEESGATKFIIHPVCIYSVSGPTSRNPSGEESFGKLYFAQIEAFEELHSEMESIHLLDALPNNWTYPEIQPILVERVSIHVLLEQFYHALSFTSVDQCNLSTLTSLFSENGIVIQNNTSISLAAYIENFEQMLTLYPDVFTFGFVERQLHYDYERKSHAIIVHSYYQKEYNENVEYGINHLYFKKFGDTYKITRVIYE